MLRSFFLSSGIAALALGLTSCRKSNETPDDDTVDNIEVARVEVDSVVNTTSFPGIVKSESTVDVVARVNGTLLSQNFEAGQMVRKGQLLFTIDSSTYRNAVESAQSALATANSNVDFYRSQYEAMQKAYAADAVSRMNVIEAESNLHKSEAAVKDAEAALSNARIQLGYCTVTAPISGEISTSAFDVGAYVSGEATPATLCHIVDNSHLNIIFSIDEAVLSRLETMRQSRYGDLLKTVPLKLENNQTAILTADLYYVSPEINTSTGTVTIEGRINNPENIVRDGMYASVSLPLGVLPHAILVKSTAIGTDQRGKYIYTVNDSDRVVYSAVNVGEDWHDSLSVIISGLTDSSEYVTKAMLVVRPGMKINPVFKK